MNRSSADREHFDKIASGYVRKDLVASSRMARRLRLERMLADVPMRATWKVLEIGCGAGFAASYLRGRFASYLGLDHSEQLIRAAEAHNSGPGIEFRRMDLRDLDDIEGIDLVFMIGVLHHLEDRNEAMAMLIRLLRPGGFLAVNEPQPANRLVSVARRVRASVDRSYTDDQDEISHDELVRLFESAGLTEISISPQGLFSTPLAEVPMGPDWLLTPVSKVVCAVDLAVESRWGRFLKPLTWNLSAVARRPENGSGGTPGSERSER